MAGMFSLARNCFSRENARRKASKGGAFRKTSEAVFKVFLLASFFNNLLARQILLENFSAKDFSLPFFLGRAMHDLNISVIWKGNIR